MMYFIKGGKQHSYPTPPRCGVRKEGEHLRDTLLRSVERCEQCLNWWPEEERHRRT